MPTRPPRPCAHAGCRDLNVAGSGFCGVHRAEADERRRAYEASRPTARERGYSVAWEKASKGHLKRNPFCVDCKADGIETLATEVDHEVPHRGDMRIFWDKSNWRSRCKTHHSRKTATRDSNFARRGHRRSR